MYVIEAEKGCMINVAMHLANMTMLVSSEAYPTYLPRAHKQTAGVEIPGSLRLFWTVHPNKGHGTQRPLCHTTWLEEWMAVQQLWYY